jgi:hypothetical protein
MARRRPRRLRSSIAFQHIRFRLPLEHDGVDFVPLQQMGQEQADRAAAQIAT